MTSRLRLDSGLGSVAMVDRLRAVAFNGDADVDDLHSFFQSELQFDGDTLWSFGTSLKSAYVNSFEFMNHAPVVQLWRDAAGALQAVSRISLGTGEWFHLAAPDYRTKEVTKALIDQADAAFVLLTDHELWETVRYETKTKEIERLEQSGYAGCGIAEVYMVRSLVDPVEDVPCPARVVVKLLDPSDESLVHERAMAQVDAFSGGEPTASEKAWITRSLPHQLSYGGQGRHPSIVAVDDSGAIVAFADPFCDDRNKIGEFEPVGTRTSAQRGGFSKLVLTEGLKEMRARGMNQAIVRTAFGNNAAIAAYQSVGFETTDRLVRYRKLRDGRAVAKEPGSQPEDQGSRPSM